MNDLTAASWRWLRDILVALVLVAIAAALYAYYGRNAGGVLPMSVCYLAVIAAAVLGGRRGGFAAIVAVLLVAWLVPQSGLDKDPGWVVVFTVIASLVVLLVSQSREQRRLSTERQAHFETVLRSIDDGVVAVDHADCVRYINPAAEHLLGVSARHAQGRVIGDLVAGVGAAAFEPAAAAGGAHLSSVAIDAPSPATGSLTVTSIPLHSSADAALGRLLVIRRRSAEHEALLALSERKLRAVFETDLWGICFTDLAGEHWLGNRGFRRMLLGEHDIDGVLHWDRLPDAASPMGLRHTLQRTGWYGPQEVEVARPDGSTAWLLLTALVLGGDEVALLAVDVSERKRIDTMLRTQRLLMRTIIDRIPAFIGYLDRDRRYRLFNRLYEEWYPGKDIQGAAMESVHEAGVIETVKPHLDRAFAGEVVHFPVALERDGVPHHFDIHYVPHQPDGTTVEGVVVHAHDISDRIRAAEQIAASERRLRSLVLASAAIVWHADRNGDIVDASGWDTLTGQSREEYRGVGWLDAVHPDDVAQVRGAWQSARSTGRSVEIEYRVCTHGGEFRHFAMRAVPVPDASGMPGEWIGTMRDVHDRRQVEGQLQRAEAEQRALLENLPNMVWIAEPDGRIRYQNKLWDEYTGLGGDTGWQQVTHPDDLVTATLAWESAIARGEPLNIELRFRRADGQYRWHMVKGIPIYDEPLHDGSFRDSPRRIRTWYGASTDIEDQKRALETLAAAHQRVSQFLAVLSHELRNPLSGVTSACELLTRSDIDETQRSQALGTMNRQTRHLQRMVDDLLDTARVTQGKVELRRENTDLMELLQEVRIDNLPKAEGDAVRILPPTGPAPCFVHGDRARLRQVFDNLVSNAIKASGAGQPVRITLRREDAQVVVEVADEGQGIAPDVRASLFDPFVQAMAWRSRGLGLGLNIVQKIAVLHGGRVEVDSAGLGLGSCFSVRLPLLEVAPAAPTAGPSPRPRLLGHVLIVDDEAENAEALAVLLRMEGFTVDIAHDADGALSRCRASQCDVVLCDLELPGSLSGYDVARAMRGQPDPPYLIAYSGYGQHSDRQQTAEAGFKAHVVKPALLEEILAVIQDGLRRKRASEAL